MISKRAASLTPYVAGEQPKDKKYIKLNTNENPYPPSPSVARAVRIFDFSRLKLYPDPDASLLKKAIAEFEGVGEENVFLGNGSDEVLSFAFYALFDGNVAFPDITYSFYPVYCDYYGISYNRIPLREDFTVNADDYIGKNHGGIALANPNAPTSIALGNDVLEKIVSENECNVIIDEAYVDFSRSASSCAPLTKKYKNLLVVKTFSKSYSLAGMRVGYAVGGKELIGAMEAAKNSFNSYPLDMLAQTAALAAFRDREYFEECVEKVVSTRDSLALRLTSRDFTVLPSSTNFLFVSPPNGIKAEELYKKLRENGILVRYWNAPRINNFLRITVGTDAESDALIDTLDKIISCASPSTPTPNPTP